eukprot:TRINITY_DN16873_c0_g1_i1.p1 TRINITY_DN16873_c0_g1~~TRINITY_DN16873_c0_g1_i1.p1  ORF type:complete len:104 (+),score=23.28 TRINITY_DN16873_c0_g1_i1:103-414(+)
MLRSLVGSEMCIRDRVVEKLPTWDVLRLHGGRVMEGTLKGIQGVAFDRQQVRRLLFKHGRSALLQSLWVVLGATPTVGVELQHEGYSGPVSYTHLTLPTKRIV